MAMFLARIKRVLNLGTKSITANGTYTASSDGYDGYSQVSVAVPDPPSITPSNASPVAVTANSSVKFSTNGYVIRSYSSKTPDDSNPPSVSSGDIVRITGFSGYLYKTQQSGGSMTVEQYSYTNGTTRTCTMKNGVYFTSRTDSTTYASYLKGYVQNGVNNIIVNSNSGSTVSYNTSTHELSCTKGTTSQGTNNIYFFIFN